MTCPAADHHQRALLGPPDHYVAAIYRTVVARGRRGLTLVDVLVGMTVLSVGVVTLLTTLAEVGRREVVSESIITGSMVAQAVMDRALNKGFTSVDTLEATGATYDATNYPSYTYDLTVDYVNVTDLNTAVAGPTDYKRVEVKVYHSLSGSPVTRSLVRTIIVSGVE